mmetsp:Transcript_2227/g.2894  ORF Transcript_2227/g.2894 Transcript_2227/m.2894 type:complete len:104 (+) Transcript_2227:2802-3113(+)
MSVYGKLSHDEIENMYEEFALNPTTNALLVNKMNGGDEEEKVNGANTNSKDKTTKIVEGDSKEIIKLKKQLEELKNKNSKLKKEKIQIQKGTVINGSCCCAIF